jgi:hypothetical protein
MTLKKDRILEWVVREVVRKEKMGITRRWQETEEDSCSRN